jgi:hypothetical protein
MGVPSLQLVSGVPPEECLERIGEGICPRRSFISTTPPASPPRKPVAGYVKGDRICIWKASPCNSFHRLLEARVRPHRVGTLIEGRFSLHLFSRIFIIMWLGLASLIAAMASKALIVSPLWDGSGLRLRNIGTLVFLLLFLATCASFLLSLYRKAAEEPRTLEAFLLELLDARPLKHDAQSPVPARRAEPGH